MIEAQTARISEKPQDGELIKAVKSKEVTKVAELLRSGANPNSFYQLNDGDNSFTTVLGNAVDERQLEIARLLLESGADVNKNFFSINGEGKEFYTSMNFRQAVENQDVPMIKLLIEFRAEIEKNTDSLPVIFAAKKSGVLDLLMENGFDINQQDFDGYTRLMTAAYENDLELVKTILQYKPNLEIVTKPDRHFREKMTALKLVKMLKIKDKKGVASQKEIIKLLKKAGAKR